MKLSELNDSLLRHLWLPAAANAPSGALDDVREAVNGAFQEIWAAPNDFYRRTEGTQVTVAGTATYTLAAGIIKILTPVKIGSSPAMRPIANRSDADNFGARFLGTTDPITSAQPTAFYIERTRASAGPDIAQVVLRLIPTPDAVYTVTFGQVLAPPQYTLANLVSSTDVDFPHAYVESILFPIAAHRLTGTKYFMHYDAQQTAQKAEATTAKYAQALALLGLADPNVAEVTKIKDVSR